MSTNRDLGFPFHIDESNRPAGFNDFSHVALHRAALALIRTIEEDGDAVPGWISHAQFSAKKARRGSTEEHQKKLWNHA
jgi:hypothetical protein